MTDTTTTETTTADCAIFGHDFPEGTGWWIRCTQCGEHASKIGLPQYEARTDTAEVLSTETYRGAQIVVKRMDHSGWVRDAGRSWQPAYVDHLAVITFADGKVRPLVYKTAAAALTSARDEVEDVEMLPRLVSLVANHVGQVRGEAATEVGQVAWIHAMGKTRRGIVTKVAKTRTTVAFTTASSNGRVFRKAAPAAQVLSA